MSDHTYTIGAVDLDLLQSETRAAGLPDISAATFNAAGSSLKLSFGDILDAGEITTLDGVVAAHVTNPLPKVKACKKAEIDDRTVSIIDQGFVYKGLTFSLSLPAQSNLEGWMIKTIKNTDDYPRPWTVAEGVYNIASRDDFEAMYQVGENAVTAAHGGGLVLKLTADAQPNEAGVNAVVDTREIKPYEEPSSSSSSSSINP